MEGALSAGVTPHPKESGIPRLPCKMGFPGGSAGKESACNAGDPGSVPGLGRFPWRRAWQPTPVFFPGESHKQRSLAAYSPWGHKESDATEQLTFSLHTWEEKLKKNVCVCVCVCVCASLLLYQVSLVKNLPAMLETWVQSLGWEDPLEEGTATHPSILAQRIPRTV